MSAYMYYVYILTNTYNRVLYIGVTNNIVRRLAEHREGKVDGFTKRYRLWKLIHLESCNDVHAALYREKQMKGWIRKKKLALIQTQNPEWKDLGIEYGLVSCHPER